MPPPLPTCSTPGFGRSPSALSTRLGVSLDELPAEAPSLARGGQIYRENCASCHGDLGRGDGPLAAGLEPKPADLADAAELRDASPLDFYHRVTIGVVGTAMPAFETRLSTADRWAVAAYATLLRLPPPHGDVPPALRKLQHHGTPLGLGRGGGARDRRSWRHVGRRVAAVRSLQETADAAATARVFGTVRSQLDSAYALARTGKGEAASAAAFDAYMTFEQVERSVRAKNPDLATALETRFAALRTRAAGGATNAELESIRSGLAADLENAERVLGETLSPANLFFQSFVILVREGLEAILVIGALMAFLTKTGAASRKRDIHIGVGAAVGASLLTAFALETVFRITPAKREALEGATMLVATVVLFYVSYWLLSKMEVAKWNQFVRSKVQDAVTSGSALALASAAFLAVYREGFETVLFYKALFVAGGTGASTGAIVAGIALGSVVMVGVYIAINRYGVRLPLKPFFGVTSTFLYYMAFVFAGRGVAELQEGGLRPDDDRPLGSARPGAGHLPDGGVARGPGRSSRPARGRRGLDVRHRAAPAPGDVGDGARAGRSARSARRPRLPHPEGSQAGARVELLRSLERMEADLAELRAEVERMRGPTRVCSSWAKTWRQMSSARRLDSRKSLEQIACAMFRSRKLASSVQLLAQPWLACALLWISPSPAFSTWQWIRL